MASDAVERVIFVHTAYKFPYAFRVMKDCISPGVFGAHFGGSGKWELCIRGDHLVIRRQGKAETRIPLTSIQVAKVEPGSIWSSIVVEPGISPTSCSGTTKGEGRRFVARLKDCIAGALARQLIRLEVALVDASKMATDLVAAKRYVSGYDVREFQRQLTDSDSQPYRAVVEALRSPLFQSRLLPPVLQTVVADLRSVFDQSSFQIAAANHRFVEEELVRHKEFFDSVEKVPLSDEQRRACVVLEDRNLLVAAAGSGKTASIVGKVGYLLNAGICRPDEVLILAFNKLAAAEIDHRIKDRLSGLASEDSAPRVETFHSFGRHVIKSVDGVGPAIANHEEGGATTAAAHIDRLVAQLIESDRVFALDWLIFRIVYPTTAANPFDTKAFATLSDWKEFCASQATFRDGKNGLLTLKGDVVKSHGELAIANWLYMNGVPYEYERPYEFDTQSLEFMQYRPDFYLPDIKAYLEHFAVGPDGEVPAIFERGPHPYSAAMQWKREEHQRRGTTLLETTFADFLEGTLFEKLEAMLASKGQILNRQPMSELLEQANKLNGTQIGGMIRTFIRHIKSNRLPLDELEKKGRASTQPGRALHFLRLVRRILAAYEADLQRSRTIDFDDMIAKATTYIEEERCWHGYKVVLVDEFQDISAGRARMLKALLKTPASTKLFAVGDDWQSIYRFSGSDIDLFTRFPEYFGRTSQMQLTKTFRSNQAIADTASAFVMRNPAQIKKSISSIDSRRSPAISMVTYDRDHTDQQALRDALAEICAIANKPTNPSRPSVAILARYNRNIKSISRDTFSQFQERLNIQCSTVHRAKGTEADYVVILGLERGRYGFPAEMEDDPLLGLAMPQPETYPFSEERRLFYVALTRARHAVYLVASRAFPSAFVQELIGDSESCLAPFPSDGSAAKLCKKCLSGSIVERHGRNGSFFSCSNFPLCKA